MIDTKRRLWPFNPGTSFVWAFSIMIGLLTVVLILRTSIHWPGDKSEITVLIGVLLFSFLPVLLALIDVISERGGVIAELEEERS